MNDVTQILEWEGTDGSTKSLLIVEDKSLPQNDIERKKIEFCEYNSEEDEWQTTESVDYVEELLSFGIPESLVD